MLSLRLGKVIPWMGEVSDVSASVAETYVNVGFQRRVVSGIGRLAVLEGEHRQVNPRVDVELGVGVLEMCVDGMR